MAGRLSIFHPPGVLKSVANPFGKDVANLELYRALARHGGFEGVDVLSVGVSNDAALRDALLEGAAAGPQIRGASVLNTDIPKAAGALLRGQPYLNELAWIRRRGAGDGAYSLLGLIHTLAPPNMRQSIETAMTAPVQPWDAMICTSPAVRDVVEKLYADWGAHLAERTGGRPPPRPALPVVPLGVRAEELAALADRPETRASQRAALGLDDEAVLILWVGRLSFFEKAFPQPMFRAVQQAAKATGAKVHFAMSGWFPFERDRRRYEEAAAAYAPDVSVSFPDGNDKALLGELWAASDVFLSLVDNIQETFGITPLEAMAAGLPVVASDWDGYRYTMRHGREAFLVPTLIGPANGLGAGMALRHLMTIDPYQVFVGEVAQHTAVHVGQAAEALAELIRNPDLRRRMGAAGRARVAEAFDWPVVAGLYRDLLDELAGIRAAQTGARVSRRVDPALGDPFADFAGFATHAMGLDMPIRASPAVTADDLKATRAVELDKGFHQWRGTLEECVRAFELLAAGEAATVREVLTAFPVERRRAVELGLAWMAKHGFVDWLT